MSEPDGASGERPRVPAIPYGLAYFKGIRREGCLYVDKTRFLHPLEQERFVFFIRPRRFGKTCWLSMMESYYDRNQADDFKELFGGLDVGRRPTPNRNRYLVLRSTSPPSTTPWRRWSGNSRSTAPCRRWMRWSAIRTCSPARLGSASCRRRASTDASTRCFCTPEGMTFRSTS